MRRWKNCLAFVGQDPYHIAKDSWPTEGSTVALDEVVAQHLYRSHLFERALHSPGPWRFEVGGHFFDAEREIDHEAQVIRFAGAVPVALCNPETAEVSVWCRGDFVAKREVPIPLGASNYELVELKWELGLSFTPVH